MLGPVRSWLPWVSVSLPALLAWRWAARGFGNGQSCIVASMVSRRAGPVRSHLAYGTGMPRPTARHGSGFDQTLLSLCTSAACFRLAGTGETLGCVLRRLAFIWRVVLLGLDSGSWGWIVLPVRIDGNSGREALKRFEYRARMRATANPIRIRSRPICSAWIWRAVSLVAVMVLDPAVVRVPSAK